MPANHRWTVFPTANNTVQQVFGVYGVKRKNEGESDTGINYLEQTESMMDEQIQPKRICNWPAYEGMNNVSAEGQFPAQQNTGNCMEQSEVCSEETTPQLNNNNQSTQCNSMIMNINEDDGGMDEYQSACDAMDSEGAVNPSQYGTARPHDQYCFGMEESPNSGRYRCYCRPSWDAMMETKSFYSDVY